MSETSFSIGHDGTRFVLTANIDGTVRTARLAAGAHTDAEHDALVASLRTAYASLRQWSTDAQTVFNNWSGTTYNATKDGQIKELFRRNGVLLNRVADLLQILNADQ